jgi:hypothetical protein
MDFARDVIVSTIYDPSYSATGLQNIVTTPPGGKNTFIGGIAGRGSRSYRSGVVNCVIGGVGATEVGGILGRQEQYNTFANYSMDTRVFGASQIGGIVGRYSYEQLNQNVSNATVEGTGQYVGGIVGYLFSSQPLFGTRAGSAPRNMFAGTVTGQSNVGGIVGYVQGELYPFIAGETRGYNSYNAANHMLGNVTATGANARANFLFNLDPAYTEIKPYYSRILGGATLTVNGQTHTADWLATNQPAQHPYKKAMYYDGPTDTGGRTVPTNFFDAQSTQLNATQANALQNSGITDPNNPGYRVPIILGEQGLKIDTQAGSMTYGTVKELAQTTLYNSAHYKLSYDRADGKSAWWDGRLRYIYRSAGSSAGNGYFSGVGGEFWYGSTGILAAPSSAQTPGSAGFLPYAASYNGLNGSKVQSYYSEGSATGTPGVPDLSGTRVYRDTSNNNNYTGGIAIPAMSSSFTPFGLAPEAALIEGEANIDAYATGADKLNLEFPALTPDTEFMVLRAATEAELAEAREGADGADAADEPAGGEGTDGADGGIVVTPASAEGGIVVESEDDTAAAGDDAGEREGGASDSTTKDDAGSLVGTTIDFSNYKLLYESALEQRSYSFNYDFTTPLVVLVNQGGSVTSFSVDPVGMRRSVMVYGDALYHVTAAGVQSSELGLLPGTYLHLQNGEALAEGGVVYDLASGSIARHVGEFALVEGGPVPLFSGSADGATLQTFKGYTVVGDGVTQPMRILASDGTLFPVDPALPVVADAVLAGVREVGSSAADGSASGEAGDSYLTVLDDEGNIVDTQGALTYPENFSASGVAEMSNNLGSDSSIVMVRYSNGKVVAFNYLSGETVELVDAAGDESFADYTSRFFSEQVVSKLAGLATGYRDLADFKAAVEEGRLAEGNIGPNLGSDAEPSTSASAATGDEPLIDGEPVVPEDGARGGGTATGDDGTATGGDDSGAAATSDAGGADGSGGSGGSGDGAASVGGLAKPAASLDTVAMFNYGAGLYELFDRRQLLNSSNAEPLATMDSENLMEAGRVMAETANAAGSSFSSDPLGALIKSGILPFAIVLLAIGILLTFLFVRRNKLSRR